MNKCFACDKSISKEPRVAFTFDGNSVTVGRNCYRHISNMTIHGWQYSEDKPRLYTTMLPLCKCHWPWEGK
jgi:hypothetical protein